MADKKFYRMHAEVCKALAHPLRIELIEIIRNKELCFSDILEKTGGLKSTLSQHLSIMVEGGILVSRKDSRCSYFRVASPKVNKACGLLREVLADKVGQQAKALRG